MSESSSGAETLTPIKRALLEIRELRARLAESESARRDPIAITGIGLRLPGGARDSDSFARLLWDGVDAITPVPADRWDVERYFDADPDAPGKMLTRDGGFLEGVDQFDAEFFGISPREAASMDPQQRLVLQVAWEALENAGQAPTALMGRRAGVYLGIANNDYGRALFAHPELIDVYFSAGNAYSVAAGRVSYFLGAQGPAVSVDTACSSSLVALHLACQALRAGECDLALAGGVNLILSPEMNINFSKARMMAPNGRCKTFDDSADGYVRGEGVAFVVLERLADATRQNRRVRALVRGSAINQDGRSNGLTAPNGPAQEAVIRAALENAGVRAADVGYVETHGTGTPLGDPIEAQALGTVLRDGRDASQPVMIGSLKTNLGHLEAAAGVAGLVKAVLVLEREAVPPHLNLTAPSTLIDWDALRLTVPTTLTPWPRGTRRRIVGVSSFGFSGTNAHVILEEAPPATVPEAATLQERPLHVLPLSARDDETLRALAQRHHDALATCDDVAAWCYTASVGRAHFSHRVSVRGASVDDLRDGLAAYLANRAHPAVVVGQSDTRPKVAFLFTGQGAQHVGMARALYRDLPTFRDAFDRCAAIVDPMLGRPLAALLYADIGDAAPIDDAALAQPALFAVEYALATVWRSWGVEPAAVLGHSFGEYVAACVAGVMSLDDAVRMVIERTRLVHALAPDGAMAAIFRDEASVTAAVAMHEDVSVAAFNGPDHVVVSGARSAVEALCVEFEAAGARVKRLHVSYGSHSPLMEPVLAPYERAIDDVRFSAPAIPLVSNISGDFANDDLVSRAGYWRDHLRQPVRFAQAMRALQADGITHYVEIGPHPVLLGIGASCVAAASNAWLPSLRRDTNDWATMLDGVQALYAAGASIDWAGLDAPWPRRHVTVPTYPFRARRHWMDSLGIRPASDGAAAERWPRLERAMERASMQAPVDLDVASYPAAWDALARLTSAHATQVLRDAGLFSAAGERRTLDDVMSVAGIGESYRHLMQRRLDTLAESGALRAEGGAFTAPAPLAEPDVEALTSDADRHLAGNPELMAYVRHCGGLMSAVLTGRESPLETLFPGGSPDLAVGLYQRSQTMRWVNGLASAALASLGAGTDAGQQLRVLELGAGTGGTTSALLPVLPADRTSYRFTDVSDFFFHQARERLAAYPFVEFGRFDLDVDPASQGYAAGSVDVIISANAVHASRDLRATLAALRTLLAPGGVLVLVESTTHFAWFDMTTGLIEGWQHFADDLRGDHPLLDAPTWLRALGDAGFTAASAYPGPESIATTLGQHVIVALAPGEASATFAPMSVTRADAAVEMAASTEPASVISTHAALRERLDTALADERGEVLRDMVRDAVVQVLRLDPREAPSRRARLMELGVDSLMAVQLRNVLGTVLGLEQPLPATLMFDHPTIDALAAFLETKLSLPTAALTTEVITVKATPAIPALHESAIASMSDDEVERLLLERLGGAS